MIVSVPYRALGNEVVYSGTTLLNIAPASGYVTIDVLLNGFSQEIGVDVEVDNVTGNLLFNTALQRGDHVLCVFKQLPRYAEDITMTDFDPADFSSTDFA